MFPPKIGDMIQLIVGFLRRGYKIGEDKGNHHPPLRILLSNLTSIFQMGWNHQLDNLMPRGIDSSNRPMDWMDWPIATRSEASTILEAFETSLETLGRGWSHHRSGRGHWNQWGVLLGWPFGQVLLYSFLSIICFCVFFWVLGNMGHFYVVFFVFVCFGKNWTCFMANGSLWVVNECWWTVLEMKGDDLCWRVEWRGCWDIGIGIWEGLALFLKPLLGSVKWCQCFNLSSNCDVSIWTFI